MTGAEFEKHKKTILILGSGYVARPVVDYLHAKGYTIIIGTEDVEGANEIAAGRSRIRVERVDATGSVACLSEAQLCIRYDVGGAKNKFAVVCYPLPFMFPSLKAVLNVEFPWLRPLTPLPPWLPWMGRPSNEVSPS